MADKLNASGNLPCKLVYKVTAKTNQEIADVVKEANYNDDCLGIVTWCHTFSPSKMWINGFVDLQKPYCHFATQYNREIPNEEIDMDFMNLNQAAHGDREHGFIGARMRLPRKVIAGYWQDKPVQDELAAWMRAAVGYAFSHKLRIVRFGDNMRDVAVTEGDKVETQIKLGWQVDYWPVGHLVETMDAVTEAEIDAQMAQYKDRYDFATDDLDTVRYQAKEEAAMRKILEREGAQAFINNFQDLYGMEQLPGLASQNMMADGIGYGGEGDWKVAAMTAIMKAMAEEDDLAAGEEIITSRNSVVDSLLDKAYDGKTSSATIIINSRSYEIHASPVESDEGIHGAVLFYVDVTEKVEAEQLRREFSANVSHELKTPLHSISGCAELMLSGIVKEEDKPRFLKQIYDEAQHMVSLIENIIKISRLDEEVDALPVDKVDLYEIAQTVIEQLGNKAASRGIVMDLSGTHVTIKGVKTLLYEMIYNLCDNAIKYNVDDGAISVSVKKTKDAAVVKVKDTGVGISEDQQERIFERFYRIDKSHSRASGGTGLGLSIVKHAAIWHNATIKVKSKLGKGTTFIVRFPLKLKK